MNDLKPLMKPVTVEPTRTQLNKGAKAFLDTCHIGGFSAKEQRDICQAVYKAMVGRPHGA